MSGMMVFGPDDWQVHSYARIHEVLPLPNLIEVQLASFQWFLDEGLREALDEISPIRSFNKNLELFFGEYHFGEPKYDPIECRTRSVTYAAPLRCQVRLVNKETGEVTEQEIFMGDFPLMTENGTFVINGAERVVVSQLIRSPGAYFQVKEDKKSGRQLCMAKLIPNRGAWLEFDTSIRDVISVKVDRKRKIPVTILLRAVGFGTDDEMLERFRACDNMPDHAYIQATIERDPTTSTQEAILEFYRRMRPGDPPTKENAREYLNSLFFKPRRYNLGRVGRYKTNKRLGLALEERILAPEVLARIVETIIRVNNGVDSADDIDHLGNRRVRSVGELVQNQFRIGLLRMERIVRERMSIQEPEQITPASLVNVRPVVAAMREFFGGSQLSQFMDQTNPLAELTNKRRLSALGPGGLSRERAGFEVRDVHYSHYGRICPVETPEGPNIGLIGSLSTYGRINEYGFIETPYRKVVRSIANTYEELLGQTLRQDVVDPDSGEVIVERGTDIDGPLAERLAALPAQKLDIVPYVSDQVEYLTADEEERFVVAQASARLNNRSRFEGDRISVRYEERFLIEPPERIDYMDVSPKQIVGVSAALIPFLEHDDANRALMGSNMQRQAVPLLLPEAPLVATGMEERAARDSGRVVVSQADGEVVSVDSTEIKLMANDGDVRMYPLMRYVRSNQGTCITQRPLVEPGQRVRRSQSLADSSATDRGQLALGQNVLVAFMPWEGGNFEDAILLSERLVREDKFTSIHIEKHEVEARETKLGTEEITRDIPNVSEDSLKYLDEEGVIAMGAVVGPSDILVGKITPKGETELTAEERLLRAIFGEKSREVKDSSLRVPHGERGKVVNIQNFSRDSHDELKAGVQRLVSVSLAQRRKITVGDKMAGRHGNKGVVSKVVPIEDMPFLKDGTPIDIILNPLGVPSRMNIGQILETHLGWAGQQLGFQVITPVFDGAKEHEIRGLMALAYLADVAWHQAGYQWVLEDEENAGVTRRKVLRDWLRERGQESLLYLGRSDTTTAERAEANEQAQSLCLREWMHQCGYDASGLADEELYAEAERIMREIGSPHPLTGKVTIYDGKTGEPFDQPVTVGLIYMMKLHHLVEDKVHARSTGPYSLVTQQPLGGKAQFGGQRFGEMEVWALEAYGAAHILQELLTVKSDDVVGRVKTYEAIVKGTDIMEPGVPESFKVLVKELQSLGLSVEVLNEEDERILFLEESGDDVLPDLGIDLGGFEKSD
ncbi:MAG: DNA-directed RNA polymerase subunit beta [Chloroflexi bacterium]|nr:DNA-directed RNA polymerase subunit beta [Chloroflexota bacterium]MBU1748618.1 DNA-directed RNA polymerase subunit beta [Chloroflexota bacterium]